MKGRTIALGEISGRKAAALIVDGVLDDLLVDPPEDRLRPGSVYRARPGRPMKGQGGLFVTLPERASGFLRQTKGIATGGTLLVQVSGYAEPGKAPPVSARLTFKSRYAIVTPGAPGRNISREIRDDEVRAALTAIADDAQLPEDAGLILRSAAATADADDVRADVAAMAGAAAAVLSDAGDAPELLLDGDDAHALAWRDWDADQIDGEPGAFDRHGVPEMIAALTAPAPLPGGGTVAVEPTRALVAVDVDTGGDTSPAAGLSANIAAMRALPRLLRCRGLGGQIVVDAAPMPKRDRRQVEGALSKALRADPVDTQVAGWTPLGHLELQRRRERLPLDEALP